MELKKKKKDKKWSKIEHDILIFGCLTSLITEGKKNVSLSLLDSPSWSDMK